MPSQQKQRRAPALNRIKKQTRTHTNPNLGVCAFQMNLKSGAVGPVTRCLDVLARGQTGSQIRRPERLPGPARSGIVCPDGELGKANRSERHEEQGTWGVCGLLPAGVLDRTEVVEGSELCSSHPLRRASRRLPPRPRSGRETQGADRGDGSPLLPGYPAFPSSNTWEADRLERSVSSSDQGITFFVSRIWDNTPFRRPPARKSI